MTEVTDAPAPSPPPPPPPAATSPYDDRQMALVIYILYLVPAGITHIVGLVLAYISRETAPDWLKSHYTLQIRTFWIGLLYFLVACALIVILIGIPLLVAVFVWFIVRCALGLGRLLRNEPYPTPESWMI
jgi:uncharacterized membrane protein